MVLLRAGHYTMMDDDEVYEGKHLVLPAKWGEAALTGKQIGSKNWVRLQDWVHWLNAVQRLILLGKSWFWIGFGTGIFGVATGLSGRATRREYGIRNAETHGILSFFKKQSY